MSLAVVMNRLFGRIDEEPLGSLLRKQKSITRLWPTFDDRVDAVNDAGGIHLNKEEPKLWYFKVASATIPGKEYDILLYFSNMEKLIREYASDKSLWKADDSGLDLSKLARKILTKADLKVSHNCPSFTFHGFKYMLTQRKSIYKDKENRPPDVRNPKQYGIGCKHMQVFFETLPFYANTLARHIRINFGNTVKRAENAAKNA